MCEEEGKGVWACSGGGLEYGVVWAAVFGSVRLGSSSPPGLDPPPPLHVNNLAGIHLSITAVWRGVGGVCARVGAGGQVFD